MKTCLAIAGWLLASVLAGCSPLSEHIKDSSVGRNGGFEHSQDGLPVNWIVYTSSTIPSGSYELRFDDADFKEGRQSLHFRVDDCSSTGGWHSPGITQEYPVERGATYAVSFWVKSADSRWTASIGAVAAKTGEYETIDSAQVHGDGWQLVEHRYAVPEHFDRLRFELSVRSPGELWIDDVRIERVAD